MTITLNQAESIILKMLNEEHRHQDCEDSFVIQSCELSEQKDFWIICANSEAFVKQNDFEKVYVGVNAYLVKVATGEVTIIGSAQNVEDFLQDLYDDRFAGERRYVLSSDSPENDKKAVINLHKFLQCKLSLARAMIAGPHTDWATGQKRVLTAAASHLREQGINAQVRIALNDCTLPVVDERMSLDDIPDILKECTDLG